MPILDPSGYQVSRLFEILFFKEFFNTVFKIILKCFIPKNTYFCGYSVKATKFIRMIFEFTITFLINQNKL